MESLRGSDQDPTSSVTQSLDISYNIKDENENCEETILWTKEKLDE